MLKCFGSFTLAESDSESDTDFMKFYCQRVSVSMSTSVQFRTSLVLLGLDVGLGLGQCQDTITVVNIVSFNSLWPKAFIGVNIFIS